MGLTIEVSLVSEVFRPDSPHQGCLSFLVGSTASDLALEITTLLRNLALEAYEVLFEFKLGVVKRVCWTCTRESLHSIDEVVYEV